MTPCRSAQKPCLGNHLLSPECSSAGWAGLLAGPHHFALPAGNRACSLHPGITPALGWQTREGCAALLLLQRLMKLPVDVSHNERACAGHPHRSYGRVSSSALLEQLTGWENLNPPVQHLPPTAKPNGTVFTAPHNPTEYRYRDGCQPPGGLCRQRQNTARQHGLSIPKGKDYYWAFLRSHKVIKQEGCEIVEAVQLPSMP